MPSSLNNSDCTNSLDWNLLGFLDDGMLQASQEHGNGPQTIGRVSSLSTGALFSGPLNALIPTPQHHGTAPLWPFSHYGSPNYSSGYQELHYDPLIRPKAVLSKQHLIPHFPTQAYSGGALPFSENDHYLESALKRTNSALYPEENDHTLSSCKRPKVDGVHQTEQDVSPSSDLFLPFREIPIDGWKAAAQPSAGLDEPSTTENWNFPVESGEQATLRAHSVGFWNETALYSHPGASLQNSRTARLKYPAVNKPVLPQSCTDMGDLLMLDTDIPNQATYGTESAQADADSVAILGDGGDSSGISDAFAESGIVLGQSSDAQTGRVDYFPSDALSGTIADDY